MKYILLVLSLISFNATAGEIMAWIGEFSNVCKTDKNLSREVPCVMSEDQMIEIARETAKGEVERRCKEEKNGILKTNRFTGGYKSSSYRCDKFNEVFTSCFVSYEAYCKF